jgi:hypothetical protein
MGYIDTQNPTHHLSNKHHARKEQVMAWEYVDFIITLNGSVKSGYYAKLGTRVTREGAREAWWADIRPTVMTELRKYLDAGWEPVTTIDSSCFISRL